MPLVINSLRADTQTHTHTHANTHAYRHSRTEAVLRNQARAWFKNATTVRTYTHNNGACIHPYRNTMLPY